jgi:hypothetical protein
LATSSKSLATFHSISGHTGLAVYLPARHSARFIHDEWDPSTEDEHSLVDQGGAVKGPGQGGTPAYLWLAPGHSV